MQQLQEQIKNMASEYFEDIRTCRRYIHRHPELSFFEKETAAFIQQKLTEYHIPFEANIAGNGIVAIIAGKNPSKKTIALRADIDALPITEANDVVYASSNKGVMHACGHDAHTASLLGAGRILNNLRDAFEGTVKLIFQPAEEKLPGGAKLMIEAGVLNNPNVDAIIAQHVFTPFKVGTVAYCFGTAMASTDELYITIHGKGGHGAYPQDTIDPVMISAQLLVALQQVVSRTVSPFQPAVLSFGKVIADGATNVIPDKAYLEGTFRALDETVRADAHKKIVEIATHIAEAFGARAEVRIEKGYPVLHNDEALTRRSYDRAVAYLGQENVIITTPRMGAEDFAYYSREIPACFYRLGTGNPEKGIVSNIHTPTFDIDEDALKIGMGLMAWHAIGELL
ncbi:MAG TPA: M20 family metallopeptidase [Chitinophagales bacterium]|nr:M20 family metallopeptidase [Chitinophagales bacterium]HNI55206.1 M20 family metallopeptidase [Chitinophagales bacterium]HNK97325.1 M20 family metallopeptidase [Chitinophagales bacterium]HNM30002.1 M20 family metallopeptidase [Chitinophagales bacterium]HNO29123.1 M20 family metallopeptidase [Chitinophagales bacterium]